MRSKEIEEAIKSCNLLLFGDIQLHIIDDDGGTAYEGTVDKLYNKDLETVLSYISELEKENENYRKLYVNIQGMRSGKELLTKYINDSILKDVIRDKIEELEQTKGDFATYIAVSERIQVLKEILGEEYDN